MTTSGGAGDVLSVTGDRRGVMGPPPTTGAVPRDDSPVFDNGEGLLRVIGELGAGDDGPGEVELGGRGLPVGEGLDCFSPDFVRDRV